MGELVNATATLARGICIDVQRASIRRRRHEGASLDAGWEADLEDRPAPAWEAGEADAALRGARRAAPTRRPSSTGRCPSSRSAAAPWSS